MVEQISALGWKRVTPGTHIVELATGHTYVVSREGGGDWQVVLRVGKKDELIATSRLLWLGKCRAEHHYASLDTRPDMSELVKKLPGKAKKADPDKGPAGEGRRRKTRGPGEAGAKAAKAAKEEKPPPNSAITLELDNQDREGDVLVTAAGEGAVLWARRQGSLSGSRWEVADGALPYVVVTDSPTLVREIGQQVPGVKIELASYVPPAPATKAPPESPPTTLSGQALDWSQAKDGRRDVHVASHEGVDFKILRVSGTKDYALFKQKGEDVQEIACASLGDCKAKAQELVAKTARVGASKAKRGKPGKEAGPSKEAKKGKEPGSCGCAGPGDPAKPSDVKTTSKKDAPPPAAPMDERAKVNLAMNALSDILANIPPPAQP